MNRKIICWVFLTSESLAFWTLPYYWTFSFQGFRPYRFLKPIRSHCAKMPSSVQLKTDMRKIIAAINMTLDGFCDHTAGIPDDEIHQYNAVLRLRKICW